MSDLTEGRGVQFSDRIYDSNSLGDRAKEGRRGSECRNAGTGERISSRMHVCVVLFY